MRMFSALALMTITITLSLAITASQQEVLATLEESMLQCAIEWFFGDTTEQIEGVIHPRFVNALRNGQSDQVAALMRELDTPISEPENSSAPLEFPDWADQSRSLEQVQQETERIRESTRRSVAYRECFTYRVYHSPQLLSLAARHGNLELVIRCLQAKADPNWPGLDWGAGSPLSEAATHGHLAVVRKLIEYGAQTTDSGIDGPLNRAIRYEHPAIALALLKAGANANPHINAPYHCTPLYAATQAGLSDVVEALLERGADLNIPGVRVALECPLHAAARHGYTTIIEQLLTAGDEINQANWLGDTPLMEAASQPAAARLLLQRGADHNMQHNFGAKPWHTAANRGCIETVREFARRGGIEFPTRQKLGEYKGTIQRLYRTHLPELVQLVAQRQKTLIDAGKLPNDIANLIFALEGSPSTQNVDCARRDAKQNRWRLLERCIDWFAWST